MTDFTGRAILITGASGGLGEAVTNEFLQAGATVAGVARSWKGKQPGGRFIPIEADLTLPDACRDAVRSAIEKAGALDGVLHLMGGFAGGKPVQNTDDVTWLHMLGMNLSAAFYVIRAVLPHLLERRSGRIIAVGSRAGVEPAGRLSAYSVSKAGLHALAKSVAAEVTGSGVTVNVVIPSTIDTEANRKAMPSADFSKWVAPVSIARLLMWLASEASADINGALIPIYGRDSS